MFCAFCGKAIEVVEPVDEGKELTRPRQGRLIAGVAAGMSAYFGLPVAGVRAAFVVLSIFTVGLVAILYGALIFIIPESPSSPAAQ